MTTTPEQKIFVLKPAGRWTDWAKVALGLVALIVPEVLGGGWPALGFEDAAGIALAATGLWCVFRPRSRGAQWAALGAAAALVLWPSVVQPATEAAPWVGITAGILGALTATRRLREIPVARRDRTGAG